MKTNNWKNRNQNEWVLCKELQMSFDLTQKLNSTKVVN